MDILINVVLPLSLAFIMFSLALGLTFADFTRVLTRPKAFALGAVAQLVVLPLVAFAVIQVFGLSGAIAVGFMVLSICPGGVTSNMVSKLAKGDVALSVTLTAVVSLLSLLTVPALTTWSLHHFMGDLAPPINVRDLTVAVFLITTVPVLLGLLTRQIGPSFADKIDPLLSRVAAILFGIIVVAALAGNWTIFTENLITLGPALIVLNVSLLLLGLGLATGIGLTWAERKTISLEVGIQNATLGIALAALISGTTQGFSTLALPSAVYGITMYVCALPFVAWFRTR
ncbi:MAG: bile acid:sodium symporter family protein [Paracoccaceae bacterium]